MGSQQNISFKSIIWIVSSILYNGKSINVAKNNKKLWFHFWPWLSLSSDNNYVIFNNEISVNIY